MRARAQLHILNVAFEHMLSQAEYFTFHENASLADRWYAAVEATIDQLRELPESRPLVRYGEELPKDLRYAMVLNFPNHLLFYRYSAADNILRVVGVRGGGVEIGRFLADTPMDE